MKRTEQKHDTRRFLSILAALLLAACLSACAGGRKDTTVSPGDITLPSIGVDEIDPEAAAAASRSSEAASSESTEETPESVTAEAETTEETEPDGEESTETSEPDTAAPETTEETEPASTAPPETTAAPTTAPPETTAAPTTAPPETTAEPTTAPSETAAPPVTTEAPAGVRVWMGDSRFVGIRDTVDYDRDRDVFISGWGMGYDWMLATAFPEFEKLAAERPVDICYWSLGANDITNEDSDYNYELADKYIEQVKQLIAKHPGTIFYILSYGPVGEEGMDPNNIPDCDAYNKALWNFIDYIREHTSMIYIDQGEYIERTGFRVYDGCHYDAETNKKAYAYVLAQSGQ